MTRFEYDGTVYLDCNQADDGFGNLIHVSDDAWFDGQMYFKNMGYSE